MTQRPGLPTPGTDIVRKESIEELCGHRARAMQLYRAALDALAEAKAAHRRATHGQLITTDFLRDLQYKDEPDRFDKAARQGIDRDMWRYFINGTPLGSLMDKQERDSFERALKDEPPEITPDTVFATMSRLAGDAHVIFRRGLATAFARFCRDFKSHDGFKIGPRFIIAGLIQGGRGWPYLSHYRDDDVRDIDRCMHVLDGKTAPDYQQGILAKIRDALATKTEQVETEYFRVRLHYGNGNGHVYPLRDDLVRDANRLIAAHYGETLGAGHSAREGR